MGCIVAQYLVTGGCGFIGSALTKKLIELGHQVRVLDSLSVGKRESLPDGVELIVGDVTDATTVRQTMEGVNGCFHLAARQYDTSSSNDWITSYQTNVTSTMLIFEAARKTSMPVVYASSSEVYGETPESPFAEDVPVIPYTSLGTDKHVCELYGKNAAQLFGVPNTGLRLFNIYGASQQASGNTVNIAQMLELALKKSPITVPGDGTQVRDFVYIDDVIQFFIAAMEQNTEGHHICNVCTGKGTTLNQLVMLIEALLGYETKKLQGTALYGENHVVMGCPQYADLHLSQRAETTVQEGLEKILSCL